MATPAAAAAPARLPPFNRIREDLPAFENVVPTGRAACKIPRYALTLLRATLKLGGTSFTKAMITELRLMLGSKVIWYATGSHLDLMNKYRKVGDNASFLTVDFSDPTQKEKGGEMIGGLDMTRLPKGELRLEAYISGATAPTLAAKATWGPPQDNELIGKVLQFTWSSGSGTGKFSLPFAFRGAAIRRLFMIYTGNDWCGTTASSAAWSGNTGNGTMGTVTVAAGTKVGQYQLEITEPAVNAGTFTVTDPDGIKIAVKGTVGSAFSGGGLSFTLADGATDFVSGDGFTITVAENGNGNLNRVEIKKDSRAVWDMECSEARFLQKEYGHAPQSRCYVVDFTADNYADGILRTADAKQLDVNIWLTAADNLTVYAEVLDDPENN